MNNTIIAFRAKEQFGKFLGKVFTHFSKPQQKFLADILYGIQASGDTLLSSIMRTINDDPEKKHAVEKRLSRNLADETIGENVAQAILKEGARHVKKDTLILVDPSDIRKEFGFKMENVTMVRDASRSSKEGKDVLVHGYHGCMAVACQSGRRKTIPLALKLWSSLAAGYKGENDEVLNLIMLIMIATGGNGILVYDRGGDRPAFYKAFIENGWDFIIRMTGRIVESWNGRRDIRWLAQQCVMHHKQVIKFDSHGRECNVRISFGMVPVRLPMHPDKQLYMVVVKGFGQEPMMLLTSLPVNQSFASQWRIVEGYLTRWRIEETIRFVKQSYGLENLRVLGYRSICNMASMVLAAAYFATTWLGRQVKRDVLAEHIKALSQRLSKVPEFASYAIADGIKRIFTRYSGWCRRIIEPEPPPNDCGVQYFPNWDQICPPDLL